MQDLSPSIEQWLRFKVRRNVFGGYHLPRLKSHTLRLVRPFPRLPGTEHVR
jgi:hypothetical protein